jgi:hypothetical protein
VLPDGKEKMTTEEIRIITQAIEEGDEISVIRATPGAHTKFHIRFRDIYGQPRERVIDEATAEALADGTGFIA